MSNRTLIEINHDYCPPNGIQAEYFGLQIQAYMRSGDTTLLPDGVTFIARRHHSDPEFKLASRADGQEGEK